MCMVATYSTYPEARAPEMVLETSSVLTWAQRHVAEWGGDPSRIYLVGHSAGAQLSSLALLMRAYLANMVAGQVNGPAGSGGKPLTDGEGMRASVERVAGVKTALRGPEF